jgi:predicted  nucleic acid-binding Zn-ribbon protein
MSDLQEANDAIDVKGIESLIDEIETTANAARPEILEFEAFKANKQALLKEMAALRGEVEVHKNALAVRQFTIAELDRKIAHTNDELKVAQNDLAIAVAGWSDTGSFDQQRSKK